jgi:hypothetical protein
MDAPLYRAFAKVIERRVGEFNAQDLANTAWAFAKACHEDALLFAALARASARRLDDFNPQDLVNTAWAFAKLGQLDAPLFAALARSLTARRLDDLRCTSNDWMRAEHLPVILYTYIYIYT